MLDCSSSRDLGLFLFILCDSVVAVPKEICTFGLLFFYFMLTLEKKNYGASLVYITSTVR